ncbi:nuclear transport factor 2 family protein [Sabulicella glaciei]|uniref:Nuclear transport factor 2 family protein n=1 Tax=Sabulicella glaciei TaxID=2984948 RepID=A0ABT3NPT8_9PROT|nr:nuclear transport factor 2 family protein [Roseococcus sp. MDT2-1-1]MCW8084177.1 nuclear transport factor 2 family protein [Roseococcus sp. MDT2-1-1]
MDELRRAALLIGCQQAVHRFYAALDASDYAGVAASMAPEGSWHRQGKMLTGPDEVRAALAERPAGRVTAHLVQNLVVDLADERSATLRYMTLVYRHDGEGGTGPAPLSQPLSISAHVDRLRREGDRWLAVERRSRRIFAA